ncbi:MAG: S41 family peptidase [Flavobacteriales bacterium]|nr:S41 family peptidase [Flavobacteriales bacterium]
MKHLKDYIPILVFAIIGLGYYFVKKNNPSLQSDEEKSKQKLSNLIELIANEYVDKVDLDSIVTVITNDILSQLDPHSTYISSKDFEDVSENMRGDFVGIGVTFFQLNDTIAILNSIKNGPSHLAGIQTGDRILMADQDTLHNKDLSNQSIVSKLKGEPNTEVKVTVYRKHKDSIFDVVLTRNKVPIKSVDYSGLISPRLGYIKINRFSETTHKEFETALKKLLAKKATSLVIDLRDNAGGYMEEAVKIADELLHDEQVIVYIKDNTDDVNATYASDGGLFEKGKVTLLINENSASASEILAGAIQDNDRGTIIGRRSFGKGLVQKDNDMGDGSIVRLTIARYYTPSGRSIQKPYNNGTIEYYNEISKRIESGELQHKDSITVSDSLKFTTPQGKIVYGGGGIMPDYFVPSEAPTTYLELYKNFISRYVFTKLDRTRNDYTHLNPGEFVATVTSSDDFFVDFEKAAAKTNILYEKSSQNKSSRKFLLAEYIRQLYGEDEYYKYVLSNDPMIKKAIQTLK